GGGAPSTVDPGERLRAHPGAGLVARSARGGAAAHRGGGAGGAAPRGGARRPDEPDERTPPEGLCRTSLPGERHADLGIHRRGPRPTAGDGRLGPSLAGRPDRRTAAGARPARTLITCPWST